MATVLFWNKAKARVKSLKWCQVPATVDRFKVCVEQIESWLRCNRLRMNAKKAQVSWLSTSQQIAKVGENEIQLSSARVRVSTSVIDLGFSIDNQLSMSEHIASICHSCHFQLRQLRAVRRSLTTVVAKTLVHAFNFNFLVFSAPLTRGPCRKPYKLTSNSSVFIVF